MSEALEPLKRIFEEVETRLFNRPWVATAKVKNVDKNSRMIKVAILPEEIIESNWTHVYWLNAGTTYVSGQLPEIGSEVICLFIGADIEQIIILGGGFCNDDFSANPSSDNYALPIMDKFGNKIILDSKGITITSNKDVVVNVPKGKTVVNCNKIELGNAASQKLILGDAFQTFFNAHIHTDPITATTGPPTIPMSPSLLSNVSKTE